MDRAGWVRLKELHEEARTLLVEERELFLERIRTTEPELHAELEALLFRAAEADEFFEGLTEVVAQLRASPDLDPHVPPTSDPLIGELVDHYRIESRIGSGGMGTVYLAHDTKLERSVALKFLPKHVGPDGPTAERFLLEARAAAALDHPNVCTVHEIGEANGRRYIAMTYYEGETLRGILARGPLPQEVCADYARQIAAALGAAHRRGIVHRDIKPSNVIVTPEGVVKVLDFGLAKLTDASLTRDQQRLGTVAYMAPEQLRGGTVEPRVDLWALGVVWYEMLTGRRPFTGEETVAVVHQILHERPPPLRELRPDACEDTSRLIHSLLERDPENRPESTDIVLSGSLPPHGRWRPLRRAAGVASGISIVLAGAYAGAILTGGTAEPSIGGSEVTSLAVLPLDNLTGSPEQDYFVDGITEALISELGRIGAFSVISRTSAMRYKDSDKSIPEIARELRTDLLVEGSLMRDDDAVRITATLVHGEEDRQLWSGTYDRQMRHILDLQSEVARAIAEEVQASVGSPSPGGVRAARSVGGRGPVPEAYDAYVKGRFHFNRWNSEGLRTSVEYYREAIALDSTFALAHAGLAEACAQPLVVEVFLSLDDCRDAAIRALELDDGLSEAHAALAQIEVLEWDWAEAEAAYRRALEINPNSVAARLGYSELLTVTLRRDEAVEEIRRAERLDPLNLLLKTWVAIQLSRAEREDEAVEQWDAVLEMDPDYPLATYNKGLNYALNGQPDRALEVARFAERLLGPETTHILNLWAFTYAAAGDEKKAIEVLDRIREETERGVREYNGFGAVAYLMLGREGDALDWLEKGYELRSPHLAGTTSEREFDALRHHPRFQKLRRNMGLP